MDEASLRRVLVARACEDADPEGLFVPFPARAAASREMSEQDAPEQQLAARADRLLERVGREQPGAALVESIRFAPPTAPLLLAAFALGFAADALGRERSLNLLAFPLLGLLGWNLAVYTAGLSGRLLGAARARAVARVRGAARAWARLRTRLARLPEAAESAFAGRALGRFVECWFECAGPLEAARWRARLHGGAAALALGVIAGLYVAGLAFAYEATWESTFLDARQARGFLAFVLGPAATLLGQPVPDVASLAALRAPASGPAAHWIHLWAVTVLLLVLLPRTVLGLRAVARIATLRARLGLDLEAPYFARLLAPQRGDGRTVRILPYSTEPSAQVATRLRELAHELFGNRARVEVEAHAPYGADPPARPFGGALLLVFDLAQSPEQEVHGRYLERLRGRGGDAPEEPLLVVLDEERYARLADPERVAERRRSWLRVIAEAELEAVALEPEVSPDALLDEARAALGPARESAGA